MKLVPHILATYAEIDGMFLNQFNDALNTSDRATQISIAAKRIFTDNAFFVLLWGQLENEINDLVRAMVTAGKLNADYKIRRLYYNLNAERMKFEDRLAMVTDKQAGADSAWNKAIRYYQIRNEIAHGESSKSGVSIASVAQDLYFIQSKLVA